MLVLSGIDNITTTNQSQTERRVYLTGYTKDPRFINLHSVHILDVIILIGYEAELNIDFITSLKRKWRNFDRIFVTICTILTISCVPVTKISLKRRHSHFSDENNQSYNVNQTDFLSLTGSPKNTLQSPTPTGASPTMACNIKGHGCDIADPRVSSEIHRISDFSKWIHHPQAGVFPNSKVHGVNMGPIWGRQDSGGPHVGPMNFAIWVVVLQSIFHKIYTASCCVLLWFCGILCDPFTHILQGCFII